MPHIFIDQIQAGSTINDVYMISQPILRSTTRGDLYIAMFVSDKSGRVNGRIWQATEQLYNSLPKEGFAHIRGRSEVFQSALQIVADHITVVPAEKVDIDDYLPRTEKDIPQMFEKIKRIVSAIKNPFLKALVNEFLSDKELMKNFCKAPAATAHHHSYIGGLLEHTNNMLNTAKAVMPFYPQLQSDLVLAGIFLHDMGKTEELSYQMAFGYTDSGQLLGHIVQTVIMVNNKAKAIEKAGQEVDKEILENLEHIILSHHGQYEFGSPKLPMTAEAFLISFLDNIDAKINQVTDKIDSEPGESNWTGFVKALESKLYRKKLVD
ncbi:MAG: CMP-binding protein [Planctomycetes bacterium HGW-Planctomycetes-1]|nr:MAG: CMP-binding protein [Planctomycetes bacterium HGW-Planctomycetes-1]